MIPLGEEGPVPFSQEELREVRPRLLDWERERREALHHPLPTLSLTSARWAAQICYRVFQAWVSPRLPATTLRSMLSAPAPEQPGPQSAYSVDLTLRFVAQLLERGARIAATPWQSEVRQLLTPWPLSAIGVNVDSPVEAFGFLEESGLRRLYVDRRLRCDAECHTEDQEVAGHQDEIERVVPRRYHALLSQDLELAHGGREGIS